MTGVISKNELLLCVKNDAIFSANTTYGNTSGDSEKRDMLFKWIDKNAKDGRLEAHEFLTFVEKYFSGYEARDIDVLYAGLKRGCRTTGTMMRWEPPYTIASSSQYFSTLERKCGHSHKFITLLSN